MLTSQSQLRHKTCGEIQTRSQKTNKATGKLKTNVQKPLLKSSVGNWSVPNILE